MNRSTFYSCVAASLVSAFLVGCGSIGTDPDKLPPSLERMKRDFPERYADMLDELRITDSQRQPVQYNDIACVEHGKVNVGGWYMEEVPYGQITIGEVGSYTACGGTLGGAGYPVPRVWKPGLRIKVRWSTYVERFALWHEKETTIPYYPKPGTVYAHFFEGDQARVVISPLAYPSSPEHPIARKATVPPPEPEQTPEEKAQAVEGVGVDCILHGNAGKIESFTVSHPVERNPRRKRQEVQGKIEFLDPGSEYVEYVQMNKNPPTPFRGYNCKFDPSYLLQLPTIWRPNMQFTVRWQRSVTQGAPQEWHYLYRNYYGQVYDPYPIDNGNVVPEPPPPEGETRASFRAIPPETPGPLETIERTFTIPRYAKPAHIWLHFFPNDELRIAMSTIPPINDKHPIAKTALKPPKALWVQDPALDVAP